MGVRYGTDNGVGDAAMARASWVLMALLGTGQTAHPLFAKYSKGLEQRYRRIEEGVHGFAPLHYFSVAAASHRMGPDFYLKFSAEYLDKLIATQMPEGVVPLHGEDDVASTAVFACLVMMQKPGIFRMPARKKAAAPPAGVKVTVDASQVPELQEWADQAKALCEEWYPKVSEFLATPGFAPPREMTIVFEKDKKGVADTSGNRIRVAADWIRKHPEDTGMIVHELVHVVQGYRNGGPGWLTEGIADYIRYFQYERKGITPRDLRRGSYKDGYRTAASFLAWTAQKHDKELIKKLHAAMRAGTGREELFKEWTGKDVETLWKEYLAAD
jgi:hypothetical protein